MQAFFPSALGFLHHAQCHSSSQARTRKSVIVPLLRILDEGPFCRWHRVKHSLQTGVVVRVVHEGGGRRSFLQAVEDLQALFRPPMSLAPDLDTKYAHPLDDSSGKLVSEEVGACERVCVRDGGRERHAQSEQS